MAANAAADSKGNDDPASIRKAGYLKKIKVGIIFSRRPIMHTLDHTCGVII